MKFIKTPEGYWINPSRVRYFDVVPQNYGKKQQMIYEVVATFGINNSSEYNDQITIASFVSVDEALAWLDDFIADINSDARHVEN